MNVEAFGPVYQLLVIRQSGIPLAKNCCCDNREKKEDYSSEHTAPRKENGPCPRINAAGLEPATQARPPLSKIISL
jgi:hypothetical protein